jgi:predicted SAM-dependent methyltransferase
MLRLNLGCGEFKLDGFINIDCVEDSRVKPDLKLDFIEQQLPYEAETVDQIWMIHCIEHIERFKWLVLFSEVLRVLKPNGSFTLAYPEFKECAKRFIDNEGNNRNFWRATLYGRQMYPSDYHVTPMDSHDLKEVMENYGFYRVNFKAESTNEPYNTIMCGYKDPDPITREMVLISELGLAR